MTMKAWYQRVLATGMIATLMLVLTGCDNCTDAEGANDGGSKGNTCLKDHCGNVTADACLESGKRDGDCCAMPGQGGCAVGCTFTSGERCHSIGAHTTCCYCDPAKTDDSQHIEVEESHRWWILALGFLFGFGFCFACCMGCACNEPVKTHLGEDKKNKVWGGVLIVCLLTAVLFHGALKPNSVSGKEAQMLDIMGGIGDAVGFLFGIVLLVAFKPWLAKRLAAQVQAPSPVGQAPLTDPPVVVGTPVQTGGDKTSSPSAPSKANDNLTNHDNNVAMNGTKNDPLEDDNPTLEDSVQPAVALASAAQITVGLYPPLAQMVDVFKRELGIDGANMDTVISAACEKLEVQQEDRSLIEKARLCWNILQGVPGPGVTTHSGGSAPTVVGVVMGQPI